MIETFILRLLISIAVIFSLALTIMLAMSFGMWISVPWMLLIIPYGRENFLFDNHYTLVVWLMALLILYLIIQLYYYGIT